jgi:hypothetical protein
MSVESFTISPRGPFSLAEAASFGFGQREGQDTGAGKTTLMRLAFCVDGYAGQAGVEVRQDAAGDVRGTGYLPEGTDPAAVRDQVARVLSLDHDAPCSRIRALPAGDQRGTALRHVVVPREGQDLRHRAAGGGVPARVRG